jgi:hypothetical protein
VQRLANTLPEREPEDHVVELEDGRLVGQDGRLAVDRLGAGDEGFERPPPALGLAGEG